MYFDPEELKILQGIQRTLASMQVDLQGMMACCDRIIDRIPPIKEKTIVHLVVEPDESKREEVVKLPIGDAPVENNSSITEIVDPIEKSSSLPVAFVQETTESLSIGANASKVRDTYLNVHFGKNLLADSGCATSLYIHPSHICVKSAFIKSYKINRVLHGIDQLLDADHCLLLYDKPDFPANQQFRKLLAFKGETGSTASSAVRLTIEKKDFISEIVCVGMRIIKDSQRPFTTDVKGVDAQNVLISEEYAPKSIPGSHMQRILIEDISYFLIPIEFLADPTADVSYFRVEQCLDSSHALIMIGLSCLVDTVAGITGFRLVNTILYNSFLLSDIKSFGCPLSAGLIHFFTVIVVDSLGFMLVVDNYMCSMWGYLSCLAKGAPPNWGINHLYLVQTGSVSRQICMIPLKKSRQATHSALTGTVPTTHLHGLSLHQVFSRSLNDITKPSEHGVLLVPSISFMAEVVLHVEGFFALQGGYTNCSPENIQDRGEFYCFSLSQAH